MAHAIKALLSHYDAAYLKMFGARYPVTAKDCALAKRLLARYPPEQLTAWIDRFFAMDDAWIKQTGYSFGVFSACLSKVIATSAKATAQTWTDEQRVHAHRIHAQQRAHAQQIAQDAADDYYRTHPWAPRPRHEE